MKKIFIILFFILLDLQISYCAVTCSDLSQVERKRYDSYTGMWVLEGDDNYGGCSECRYYRTFLGLRYCPDCYYLIYEIKKYNFNDYPFYYDDYSPFILEYR